MKRTNITNRYSHTWIHIMDARHRLDSHWIIMAISYMKSNIAHSKCLCRYRTGPQEWGTDLPLSPHTPWRT